MSIDVAALSLPWSAVTAVTVGGRGTPSSSDPMTTTFLPTASFGVDDRFLDDRVTQPEVVADDDSRSGSVRHAVVICAYSSVIVASIFGNGLVVLSVVTCRRMRSVTNYFIVSLASADLLMALGIPFALVANWVAHRWPFGAALCPIITYLQVVAVFLSAFTLVGLSVDRFRAIVFPLRPRVTGRQAAVAIGTIWLLAASVPLPVAIVSRVDPTTGYCVECWPDGGWQNAYSMSVMVLQYFLPLGVLAATYATICYVIWVKKAPGESLQNGRDRRVALAKRKVVKMMIVVVVVYALCWLPLHGVTLLGDFRPTIWHYEHIQTVWIACHWLAMSSCCWNPIIYCWTNDTFRAGFLYALLGRCPCRSVRRHACRLFDKQPTVVPPHSVARQPPFGFHRAGTDLRPSMTTAAAVVRRLGTSGGGSRPTRGGSMRMIAAQVARCDGGGVSSAPPSRYASVESVFVSTTTQSTMLQQLSTDGTASMSTRSNWLEPAAAAKRRGRQLCRPSLTRKLNNCQPSAGATSLAPPMTRRSKDGGARSAL